MAERSCGLTAPLKVARMTLWNCSRIRAKPSAFSSSGICVSPKSTNSSSVYSSIFWSRLYMLARGRVYEFAQIKTAVVVRERNCVDRLFHGLEIVLQTPALRWRARDRNLGRRRLESISRRRFCDRGLVFGDLRHNFFLKLLVEAGNDPVCFLRGNIRNDERLARTVRNLAALGKVISHLARGRRLFDLFVISRDVLQKLIAVADQTGFGIGECTALPPLLQTTDELREFLARSAGWLKFAALTRRDMPRKLFPQTVYRQ